MALFKISQGKEVNLPSNMTEGYCYVTLDGQKFYFDYKDENGELQRGALNAAHADKLKETVKIGGADFDGSQAITLDQIGAAPKTHTHNTIGVITLEANSWANNTQTVTFTGVTASNIVIVGATPSSTQAYGDAGIICTAQATNSLTFTCEVVPTTAIEVNVVILG